VGVFTQHSVRNGLEVEVREMNFVAHILQFERGVESFEVGTNENMMSAERDTKWETMNNFQGGSLVGYLVYE
jgi:hypothetical protein